MDRPHHLGEPVRVVAATPADSADWAELRHALWPNHEPGVHAAAIAQLLAEPGDTINFIARLGDGRAAGLAEASLRRDVNGCKTSPVAFLEGIYVLPEFRRNGIARLLVTAVEEWARTKGCTEFASDAAVDNLASQQMHSALGFTETQRVVFFRKELDRP